MWRHDARGVLLFAFVLCAVRACVPTLPQTHQVAKAVDVIPFEIAGPDEDEQLPDREVPEAIEKEPAKVPEPVVLPEPGPQITIEHPVAVPRVYLNSVDMQITARNVPFPAERDCPNARGKVYDLLDHRGSTFESWFLADKSRVFSATCTSVACVCTGQECFQSPLGHNRRDVYAIVPFCTAEKVCTTVLAVHSDLKDFRLTSQADDTRFFGSRSTMEFPDLNDPGFLKDVRSVSCAPCPPRDQQPVLDCPAGEENKNDKEKTPEAPQPPRIFFPNDGDDDAEVEVHADEGSITVHHRCADGRGSMYDLPENEDPSWNAWHLLQNRLVGIQCTGVACACTADGCFQSDAGDESTVTYAVVPFCGARKCTTKMYFYDEEGEDHRIVSRRDSKRAFSSQAWDELAETQLTDPLFLDGVRTMFCGFCPQPETEIVVDCQTVQ